MEIEVRLFATLREGRGKKIFFQFEKGISPHKIIKLLNIKEEDVSILLINGRNGELNVELNEGDVVSIFPPVGGG
ncbi:MoaD/ThiS family protein [Paramaledivibacter caminithermalis]|uniref:Molybdopterin converting factor, small subunit n=1 Tax=Paramaledivibacter caminithermalis (strain DSM 15212 / CIP 107654 / DViRD3) TaxID=1121301 RepID=A0A1M6KWN6_PARC5|nr:MoaD/ThiS family protein [Paramaledivibacter caminithermalis]SHJ63368.1 Molybdopterin converting factor, small subunit [Paramaledivibacter caminithermalis DSM 15212]